MCFLKTRFLTEGVHNGIDSGIVDSSKPTTNNQQPTTANSHGLRLQRGISATHSSDRAPGKNTQTNLAAWQTTYAAFEMWKENENDTTC